LGFVKATNAGIKRSTGDYVILLNNDTELTEQKKSRWIELLEAPFKNKSVGITGPSLMTHLGLNSLGVVFFCAMIKRQVIDTIGLLDEGYGLGGVDDHDFSERAMRAGFVIARSELPFPIIHKENQTFKENQTEYIRSLQKNENYFRKKFGTIDLNLNERNKNMQKYSIVIGTYNHCDDLLKVCVEAIVKYTNLEDIELIIIANGCNDETKEYLLYLESYFKRTNIWGFQQVFFAEPLGYARANNIGIRLAHADKLILLNNDAFLQEQPKSDWLRILDKPFEGNPKCGITCVLKTHSDPAGRDFAIFFCVMIKKEVFDKIGLLNEDYGKGGGEDTEFCIEAEAVGYEVCQARTMGWSEEAMLHVGNFPVYHRGEGTVHDVSLVPDWNDVFVQNSIRLAKKYNPAWLIKLNYKEALAELAEQDPVMYKEVITDDCYGITKDENIKGRNILDIGANIGTFTLLASCFGAKKVVAVEPISVSYQRLIHNISHLKLTNVVPLKNIVAEVSGEICNISLNENSGANSRYNVGEKYETVETITLSDALTHFDDDNILLKLDCEGAEYDIILNATDTDMARITKIIMEIHTDLHPKYKGYEILHEKLRALGFTSVKESQMGAWDIDAAGNMINYRDLPFRNEAWEKVGLLKRTEHSSSMISIDHEKLKNQDLEMYKELFIQNSYGVENVDICNRVVVDIGGNIGMFSLLCVEKGATQIICVEAQSKIYQSDLLDNVKQYPIITPLNYAVTDFDDRQVYILNEGSCSTIKGEIGESVNTITLETLLSQQNVFGNNLVLKLDCEGSEFNILLGTDINVIRRFGVIFIEVHANLNIDVRYRNTETVINRLQECGFIKVKEGEIIIDYGEGNVVGTGTLIQKWVRV